jgi:hypothetical protein
MKRPLTVTVEMRDFDLFQDVVDILKYALDNATPEVKEGIESRIQQLEERHQMNIEEK